MRYKLATFWSRPGESSMNHYDDGWLNSERPVGHTSWAKGPWEKHWGYLVYDLIDSRYCWHDTLHPNVPTLLTRREVFELLGVCTNRC